MARALLLLVVCALAVSCVLATLPAPPVPSLPSFDDVWDVQTDFLHLGVRQGVEQRSTLFSMVHDVEMVRENCRLIRAAGDDSYTFYVYNERDGADWDQFAQPFNGYEDQGRVLDLTAEILNNGCHPIPSLIPDDAPALTGGETTREGPPVVRKMRRWWPELLPKLAEQMDRKILWLWLEGNEYLHPEDQIQTHCASSLHPARLQAPGALHEWSCRWKPPT